MMTARWKWSKEGNDAMRPKDWQENPTAEVDRASNREGGAVSSKKRSIGGGKRRERKIKWKNLGNAEDQKGEKWRCTNSEE